MNCCRHISNCLFHSLLNANFCTKSRKPGQSLANEYKCYLSRRNVCWARPRHKRKLRKNSNSRKKKVVYTRGASCYVLSSHCKLLKRFLRLEFSIVNFAHSCREARKFFVQFLSLNAWLSFPRLAREIILRQHINKFASSPHLIQGL